MAEETRASMVTAFFELSEDVDRAIAQLREAGVGRDQITIEERHGGAEGSSTLPGRGGGLFGILQDTVTPDAGQGSEGGGGHTGYLLTVHAAEGPARPGGRSGCAPRRSR